MDKEQKELQSLGFFGIWGGSFKIISTWSQIFLRVALALTLPLSFIYLTDIEINHLLSQNISDTLNTLATIANVTGNTTPFVFDPNNKFYEIAGIALLRDIARYTLFHIAYLIFHLISSFLPAGVIYTVACIYSGKSVVTVKEVIYVIPKVWKRLLVNLLYVMGIKFVYNLVFGFILIIIFLAHPGIEKHNYIAKYDISDILSSAGVWYMDVVWQLANTISVLEEICGPKALRKSKQLIKGKMGVSFAIFSVCKLLFNGTIWLFNRFVVVDRANVGMIGRVGFGLISLLLVSFVILLGEVVRMVLYLVCKSYHNEQIDKFTLTGHLEVDHGEGYLYRKPEDGQLMESADCI